MIRSLLHKTFTGENLGYFNQSFFCMIKSMVKIMLTWVFRFYLSFSPLKVSCSGPQVCFREASSNMHRGYETVVPFIRNCVLFQVFEPSELERGHFTDLDSEIKTADIPERFMVRIIIIYFWMTLNLWERISCWIQCHAVTRYFSQTFVTVQVHTDFFPLLLHINLIYFLWINLFECICTHPGSYICRHINFVYIHSFIQHLKLSWYKINIQLLQ